MRKNRKLGKMFTIIVDMGAEKYMYSVTAERFNELLTAKDRSAFADWKGHTDYSYCFGVAIQLSDGLWYPAGQVKNKNAKVSRFYTVASITSAGLTYAVSDKQLEGCDPVEGVQSVSINIALDGVPTVKVVSVDWLASIMRSFLRYEPLPGCPGVMRLPSTASKVKKAKAEGIGKTVDHIFKYGSYDKV